MRIKTSKKKKIACLTFCAFYSFYARKKRLSESVACLRFVLFVRVKSYRLKNKTALIPSFILLLKTP